MGDDGLWAGSDEGGFCLQQLVKPGPFLLDVSTDLERWAPLLWTNVNAGLLDWCDPAPANAACRFYRLRRAPR